MRPKGTPAPRRTLRFKSVPTSQSQGSITRDPLTAYRPRRTASHHERAISFSLGATLASLSLLPRRSTTGGRGRRQPNNFDFVFHSAHQDPYLQELAASAPQKRNWRGILTAFAMIIFLSSIILAAIFFLTPCEFVEIKFDLFGRFSVDANADELKKPISLKDAISGKTLQT